MGRIGLASLLLVTCATLASGQQASTGFLDRTVTVGGNEHAYQVYIPRGYDDSEDWPVILFLHGAGERGNDGLGPTQTGLGTAIRRNPERWPAIVVFPQAPQEMSWQGTPGEVAMAALDATIGQYRVDEARVYLTGLSLGGNGSWYLGYHHTDRFAALVAVCGFVGLPPRLPHFLPEPSADPYADLAAQLAEIPIWIFHGDADTVVPVEESRKMAAALEDANADVRYDELPGVNHNAWDPAYGSEELADWLLSKRRR